MLRNWRKPRTLPQNCYLERRRRRLHQRSLTNRQLLTRQLSIDRQSLIDGRRRPRLPSSGRPELKNPSANSRSPMTSPASPSRPRIRRSASWKSSMHFAGHSVCQPAATASRTGQVNRRRNCNTLATFGEAQSKVDLRLRAAKGPLIPLWTSCSGHPGFCNGPRKVNPFFALSSRRVLASVRDRHGGRHQMGYVEDSAGQSTDCVVCGPHPG